MALSRVQAAPKATGNPGTITFSSPPTVGNAIIVASVAWGGTATATCVDNRGNTYQPAVYRANGAPRLAIYYCAKITTTGSPFTITFTFNGQYSTAIEVSGLTGSDELLLDETASLTGTSATPSTGTTAAITGADAFAVIAHSFNTSLSSLTVEAVTPTWTQDLEDLTWAQATGEIDSRPLTGVGGTTQSGSWTASGSADWVAAIAVFRAGALTGLPTPLAYWPLDEATGATAADASGHGHTATLVNGTWDTSALKKFGAAALANTASGRAASFSPINLGAGHAVAFWMNGWSGNGVLLGGAADVYACYLDSTWVYYSAGFGNTVFVTHGGLTGSHHVVITRHGATIAFYKDGTLLGTATLTIGTTAQTLGSLGGYDAGGTAFTGTLDDVRFYDVHLSSAQVAELYALVPTAPAAAERVQTFLWLPV